MSISWQHFRLHNLWLSKVLLHFLDPFWPMLSLFHQSANCNFQTIEINVTIYPWCFNPSVCDFYIFIWRILKIKSTKMIKPYQYKHINNAFSLIKIVVLSYLLLSNYSSSCSSMLYSMYIVPRKLFFTGFQKCMLKDIKWYKDIKWIQNSWNVVLLHPFHNDHNIRH